MKRFFYPSFIVFLSFISLSFGQNIHISTDTVINVSCNHLHLGSATVRVTNVVHPPYSFQWSNGLYNTNLTASTADNLDVGTYTVTITDSQDGDLATVVLTVNENPCEISAEAMFTPNGDGYNDTWVVDNAVYFPDAWLLIYNRLGQKVYEHSGLYVPWEGQDLFGAPLPDAAYYYIIYPNRSDKSKLKKGSVSIVR